MKYNNLIKIFIISTALAIAAFIYFYFSETGTLPNFKKQLFVILWSVVVYNVIGFVLHKISNLLNVTLPYVSGISKRLIIGFFINIFSGTLLYYSYARIYFLFQDQNFSAFLDDHPDLSIKHLIVFVLFILIYTLVDFTLFSFNYFTSGQIAQERIKREKLHLQFQALKNQLSPHFLFNSLNTISSLIYKDTQIAEKYIRKLADTYEYILKSLNKNLVTLKEELLIVKAYKFLMEVRYHKAFSLQINIPEKYESYLLPPLSIQMLVENAIKHNIVSDTAPLNVDIFSDMNFYVVIKNNTTSIPPLKDNSNNSYKIGLNNIKQRYSFFTSRQMKVEKNETFIVKLPIIQPESDEK